jgi:putative ABC transport system substrate-binding protein
VTGLTTFSTELTAKRLTMLKELAPGVTHVALLHNMGNPAAAPEWEETQAAARAARHPGRSLRRSGGRGPRRRLRRGGAHARRRDQRRARRLHADAPAGHRRACPRSATAAAYPSREFVEAGGLFAYAVNYSELYYRFASYADRIFKGAKPGDLPIERPTRFELVINAATARSLGLAVPRSLELQADTILR